VWAYDFVEGRTYDERKCQANLDAGTVKVSTDGGKVILSGQVKAWNERGIAERAAWAAPGVTSVEDNIVVAF
jgi:osmotically-inducible protein OsmY